MNTVCAVFTGLFVNWVVGGLVWAYLDYEDRRLFKWYSSAGPLIGWIVQPITLLLWPIAVFLRLTGRM